MRIYLVLFLFCNVSLLTAQTAINKSIIGTWELEHVNVETIVSQKDTTALKEEPFLKKDIILSFGDNHQLEMRVGEFSLFADYMLQEKQLTLGKFTFTITRINSDQMILVYIDTAYKRTYFYHRSLQKE